MFEINRTKIKGSCQSGRKVVTHNSKSDLPLVVSYRSCGWWQSRASANIAAAPAAARAAIFLCDTRTPQDGSSLPSLWEKAIVSHYSLVHDEVFMVRPILMLFTCQPQPPPSSYNSALTPLFQSCRLGTKENTSNNSLYEINGATFMTIWQPI